MSYFIFRDILRKPNIEDLSNQAEWKIIFENAKVKKDMEKLAIDLPERYDELQYHLNRTLSLKKPGTVEKLSCSNHKFNMLFEYRLTADKRVIYLVHKSTHEVEILYAGKHF